VTLLAFSLLLAAIAAGFVIYPLVAGRFGMLGDPLPARLLDREARKRVTLASLKDVEYDRVTGKLDDADYQELRVRLEREALDALSAYEADRDENAAKAVAAVSPGKTTAHSCGFANPPGSRFCAECGEKLT
jgi:cytochrome c-type biogenesis protein CcmI